MLGQDAGNRQALRLGVAAGASVAALAAAYVVVLGIGFSTLPAPDQPSRDPWFTLMELLILGIAPAMVVLTVALQGRTAGEHRVAATAAVVFMSLCAALTSSVHFSILTLARQPGFQVETWARQVFAFEWPSLAYALDILAWDVFFALGAAFAAAALKGATELVTVRRLLQASALLAFAGLAGVPLADMRVRNIGIVGYAVLFPLAAGLLAWTWRRTLHQCPPS